MPSICYTKRHQVIKANFLKIILETSKKHSELISNCERLHGFESCDASKYMDSEQNNMGSFCTNRKLNQPFFARLANDERSPSNLLAQNILDKCKSLSLEPQMLSQDESPDSYLTVRNFKLSSFFIFF